MNFQVKIRMLKTCVYHHELDRFPILKDIFDPMDGELNKCDLFYIYILWQNMSTFGWPAQLSKPIFSNWPMHNALNHTQMKDPFKAQARSMDLNITKYEFFWYSLRFQSATNLFINHHLLSLRRISITEHIHDYLKRL